MTQLPDIRIVLTDDHQIVIDGLAAALKNFPHIAIVATATSGQAMIDILQQTQADIMLTDLMMPGMDGQALAQAVKSIYPEMKIIALSMNGSGEQVEGMLPFVEAYLLKHCGIQELVLAIETVYNGGEYFDASVQQELITHRKSQQNLKNVGITPREKQIIQMMEKDLSNKEISSQLCISVRTVETHRKNILRKTGTKNLLTLVKWAQEHHLL